MSRKLKVVISGIHFPLSMMSYFIKAFQRRDDVELWTVGPFTDTWTPWNFGMDLPKKYVYVPHNPLPRDAIQYQLPAEMVQNECPWEPDLWLQVDAGWHLATRPKGKYVAHVQTDPHALKHTYALPKTYSDFNFCMQTPYMEEGELFLPYAYDPTIHYPEDREKEYDVCLIGLQYKHRVQLINVLKAAGVSVFTGIGLVYDEYREAYNKSRIALSWSSMDDLPARVWEAFGMALPLVTNRVTDLPTFFVENEHYKGFSSVPEAIAQVAILLEDYDAALEMAHNAHRKAKSSHTWNHRIEQILETCKLI